MKIELLTLIPTQCSVGLHQVKMKAKKIRNMNRRDLKQYLHDRPVPVVHRNGKYYLIDRHHLCSACILIDIKKVKIIITADFSDARNDEEFWTRMQENSSVLLQDSNGLLITPSMLPKTLTELSDDSYRSLAGLVRDAGAISKVNVPFSEFIWANFFRKHFDKKVVDEMLHSNLKNAVRLAKSKLAKDIPGYIG
jgi:hypothetical protein